MLQLRSFHLAVQFYQHAEGLKLPHHLKEQLLRAASSVALNLSEGTGKLSKKDRCRFFQIALGSVRECQAIQSLGTEGFRLGMQRSSQPSWWKRLSSHKEYEVLITDAGTSNPRPVSRRSGVCHRRVGRAH